MTAHTPMSLEQVQHWVVTTIIGAVASFPLGALIAVTHHEYGTDRGNAAVLAVMTAVVGIAAVVAIRLVHRTSPWSPMLVLGVLPALGSVGWTWFA